MLRSLTAVLVSAFPICACLAQSSSGTGESTTGSILDNSPLENVRAGAVGERAPSNWIAQARERHAGLSAARRAAQTTGANASLLAETESSTSTGTSSSTALESLLGLLGAQGGGLDSLLSMAGSLGLGDLSGLLGQTSTTSPSSTGDSSDTSGATLDDLLALQQQLGAAKAINDDTSSKTDTRSQTTGDGTDTTTERKFWKRWVDSMLQTTFQGIVLGINTPTFIEVIKDGLRPLFGLPDPDATTDTTDDSGGDNGGSNDGSDDGGSQI